MSKRKEAVDFMVSMLRKLAPKNKSIDVIEKYLTEMSDGDFDALMVKARDGEWVLPIYAENMSDQEIDKDKALDLAEKLDLELFHNLVLKDPQSGEEFVTPQKYLVIDVPVRRQVQHLDKKKSLPDNSKKIDHLSGQATGDSKGAAVSMPELVVLEAKGFNDSLVEMIKVRGGDDTAFRHMNRTINETGGFSLGPIEDLESNVKANETLAAILFAMHLDNNLVE